MQRILEQIIHAVNWSLKNSFHKVSRMLTKIIFLIYWPQATPSKRRWRSPLHSGCVWCPCIEECRATSHQTPSLRPLSTKPACRQVGRTAQESRDLPPFSVSPQILHEVSDPFQSPNVQSSAGWCIAFVTLQKVPEPPRNCWVITVLKCAPPRNQHVLKISRDVTYTSGFRQCHADNWNI